MKKRQYRGLVNASTMGETGIVTVALEGIPENAKQQDVLWNAAHAIMHDATKLAVAELDGEKAKEASAASRHFVLKALVGDIRDDLAALRKLVEAQQIMTSEDFSDALKQALQYDGP